MAEGNAQRRLAAVVAIDVAGYSRLMGADEQGTLSALKAHRDAVTPIVQEHGGRIVGTAGDGLLLEFPSVTEAVLCAVEVQPLMAERNAAVPDSRKMLYRIGINLGDVLVDGDNIYGDGVNVAARLETLADAGGVCISQTVLEHVRDRVDVQFDDLGDVEVKNIARPVRVWRWHPGGAPFPASADVPELDSTNLQKLLDRFRPLSIAVLPFVNMSRNKELDFLCDGLSESLITDLSKDARYIVASRNASFVYRGQSANPQDIAKALGVGFMIEGSVQAMGPRMRVNAQLIDCETGDHLTAARYDHDTEDLFEAQDNICEYIVGEVGAEFFEGGLAGIPQSGASKMEARDLLRTAGSRFFREGFADAVRSINLADRACEIDPEYAAAWSTGAIWRAVAVFFCRTSGSR